MSKIRDFAVALLKVAIENPNNTNGECIYFDYHDEPVCIIGHALEVIGINPRQIDNGEIFLLTCLAQNMVDENNQADMKLLKIIDKVQADLDEHGFPWKTYVSNIREAIKEYDIEIKRPGRINHRASTSDLEVNV